MATLPTEVVTDILSRLPAKSLIRFTCVCKFWLSLIKSPNFIKLHLNQTLTSNSGVHLVFSSRSLYASELDIDNAENSVSFCEIDHPLKPKDVALRGSCNGVLCISDLFCNIMFLFNPLTKSYWKLPLNHSMDPKNPHTERVASGFGYDSTTNDYKVFSFFQKLENGEVVFSEAKVFSLRNNSWKPVEGMPYFHFFSNHHGVVLNETVHFMVYIEELDLQHKFIMTFELRTETFSRMEYPNYEKSKNEVFIVLNALGGRLCMLINYYPYNPDSLIDILGPEDSPLNHSDLWVMKEYGKEESWVKLFRIRHPQSFGIETMIRTVVFSKDGRKLLLEADDSELGWYDIDTESFERITFHGEPDMSFGAGYFVGSLVSFVDYKLQSKGGSMPKGKKEKKRNDSDNFLSAGFKLRL